MFAALALAAALACPQFFAGGQAPAVPQPVRQLCFTGYMAAYSPDWRGPVYSAEELTADSVKAGEAQHRFGAFFSYADALVSDYDAAGYDRGHMVNADDRGPDKAETFCMCNMVPQTANLNRIVWLAKERELREMALAGDDLFVLSGPLVQPDAKRLKGKEAIPAATWKAVLVVGKGAFAYLCTNEVELPVCSRESVADLALQIGFDPLPTLTAEQEAVIYAGRP